MGIDRLGKNAPVVRPATETETGKPVEESFACVLGKKTLPEKGDVSPPATVENAAAVSATALHQVRSGAINLEQYLDLKVHEATQHLSGLPATDLECVRQALREKLRTDPELHELAERATGQPIAGLDEVAELDEK